MYTNYNIYNSIVQKRTFITNITCRAGSAYPPRAHERTLVLFKSSLFCSYFRLIVVICTVLFSMYLLCIPTTVLSITCHKKTLFLSHQWLIRNRQKNQLTNTTQKIYRFIKTNPFKLNWRYTQVFFRKTGNSWPTFSLVTTHVSSKVPKDKYL